MSQSIGAFSGNIGGIGNLGGAFQAAGSAPAAGAGPSSGNTATLRSMGATAAGAANALQTAMGKASSAGFGNVRQLPGAGVTHSQIGQIGSQTGTATKLLNAA